MKWEMNMNNLPLEEQPYEKIERLGPKALTDAELLAIVIRTGAKDEPSIYTARKLLALNNRGLGGIQVLSSKELRSVKGIGRVKSIQLKAIAEISTRLSKSYAVQRFKISSPHSVANIFMEEMRYLSKEHIKVLFLDTKNGIITDKDISVGTVNTSLVDPREVFKEALEFAAVNIILLHNHPSGDPTPSHDDIEVTKRVYEAGKVIGIELLDHIIIGDGNFVSLKEKGLGYLH
jgi:DNA repair protein RadC